MTSSLCRLWRNSRRSARTRGLSTHRPKVRPSPSILTRSRWSSFVQTNMTDAPSSSWMCWPLLRRLVMWRSASPCSGESLVWRRTPRSLWRTSSMLCFFRTSLAISCACRFWLARRSSSRMRNAGPVRSLPRARTARRVRWTCPNCPKRQGDCSPSTSWRRLRNNLLYPIHKYAQYGRLAVLCIFFFNFLLSFKYHSERK